MTIPSTAEQARILRLLGGLALDIAYYRHGQAAAERIAAALEGDDDEALIAAIQTETQARPEDDMPGLRWIIRDEIGIATLSVQSGPLGDARDEHARLLRFYGKLDEARPLIDAAAAPELRANFVYQTARTVHDEMTAERRAAREARRAKEAQQNPAPEPKPAPLFRPPFFGGYAARQNARERRAIVKNFLAVHYSEVTFQPSMLGDDVPNPDDFPPILNKLDRMRRRVRSMGTLPAFATGGIVAAAVALAFCL